MTDKFHVTVYITDKTPPLPYSLPSEAFSQHSIPLIQHQDHAECIDAPYSTQTIHPAWSMRFNSCVPTTSHCPCRKTCFVLRASCMAFDSQTQTLIGRFAIQWPRFWLLSRSPHRSRISRRVCLNTLWQQCLIHESCVKPCMCYSCLFVSINCIRD